MHAKQLAEEFNIKEVYAANIIALLDEGNTIPFIARYRKEQHGTLDDQTIRAISERLTYLRNLDKRREEVYHLIDDLGQMTEEVNTALQQAKMLTEIEDIYRPYKPKRKTRASVAKEKGLDGLAQAIMAQKPLDIQAAAQQYLNEEKGVLTAEDALQGAMDIIAEAVSDNAEIRKRLKNIIRLNAYLRTKAADETQDSVYTAYYDYSEPVKRVAGHRVLAIDRGEREGFLKVSIDIDAAKCLTGDSFRIDRSRRCTGNQAVRHEPAAIADAATCQGTYRHWS